MTETQTASWQEELEALGTPTRPILQNFTIQTSIDDKGKAKTVDIPITPAQIIELNTAQPGQPQNIITDHFIMIGDSLYMKAGTKLVRVQNDYHFSAIIKDLYQLDWRSGACTYNNNLFVSLNELQQVIKAFVPHYEASASIPHVPQMPTIYYRPWTPLPKKSTGPERLLRLIRKLWPNVASPTDHYLILAMMMAPMWGGKAGGRPAFVAHSLKRNTGKTTLIDTIIDLYNTPPIRFDPGKGRGREEHFIKDLLSPGAASVRVVRIDNMTSSRDRELVEFITTPTFSGHKMYEGAAARQNQFCWFITINVPSFDTDLTTRALFVNFIPPTPEQRIAWSKHIAQFKKLHKTVLSEIYHLLNSEPSLKTTTPSDSRFTDFIIDVLARCCDTQEAFDAIIARLTADTKHHDVEDEIIDDVLYNLAKIKKPWISADTVASTWNKAHNTDYNNVYVGRTINSYITAGRITVLTPKRRNTGAGYTFDTAKWEAIQAELEK